MNSIPGRTAIGRHRNGVALIVVLVCLGVVSATLMSMARVTLLTQRQINSWQHEEQARWLIELGMQQAKRRLVRQADYRGETWQMSVTDRLPADAAVEGSDHADSVTTPPAGTTTAELTVVVEQDAPAGWRLQVTVRYPLEATYPVKITRQLRIPRSVPTTRGDTP